MGKKAPPKDNPQVWKGPEVLSPFLVPVASLTPDPCNARTHTPENIDAIAGSFSAFGQDQFIVVHKAGPGLVVIKGHGRLAAVQKLGWTHVAILTVDDDDQRAQLRGLVDNHTADADAGSQWDFKRYADQLMELDSGAWDLADFGWPPETLEKIANWGADEPPMEPEPRTARELTCPHCGESFTPGQ